MMPAFRSVTAVLLLLVPLPLPAGPAGMAEIPAGPFIMGSSAAERELGYTLDEARGSSVARTWRWFENEPRQRVELPAFAIDRHPVTQRQYHQFVGATGHPAPTVNRLTWEGYGLIHPYATAERFTWSAGRPPEGRADHPVVLVDAADAAAYCTWRGARDDLPLGLPSEAEWEKAARGPDGLIFPWGDRFEPQRLNSADAGPLDTEPIGRRPLGDSPYGVGEMAGMVFEWTSTDCPGEPPKRVVKGGSWDDLPGVTRAAAHHCRPRDLKHVLIGFRCRAPITGTHQ